jgi:hypothetical protein
VGLQDCAAEISGTITNPAEITQRTVARVSLPIPQKAMAGSLVLLFAQGNAEATAAQAHPISRHPDGSIRRMMVSVPLNLAAGETRHFEIRAEAENATPLPSILLSPALSEKMFVIGIY